MTDETIPPPAPELPAAEQPAPVSAATAPPAPAQPNAFVRAFVTIAPARYGRSAISALITFAAAWLFSFLTVIIALIGTVVSQIGSKPQVGVVPTPQAISPQSLVPGIAWLFETPGQLVAASLGGTLSAGTSIFGVTISVAVLVLPLLITAVVITGLVLLTWRDERVAPTVSRGARWILSVVTGLVLAVVTLIIAAVLPVALSGPTSGAGGSATSPLATLLGIKVAVTGASVTGFVGALVIGTLVTYLVRARIARRREPVGVTPLESVLRQTVATVGFYLAPAAVLALIAIVIGAISQSASTALWAGGLWLPTAVIYGLSLANFSVISSTGSASGIPGAQGLGGDTSMVSAFPLWLVLIVVVVDLLLILFVGTAVAARGEVSPRSVRGWGTTVGGFAALGVLFSVLGSISFGTHVDTSVLQKSLGGDLPSSGLGLGALADQSLIIGPAAWTFLVFAILGALVQVVGIWVGPTVLRILPSGFATGLGGLVTRFAGPVAVVQPAAVKPEVMYPAAVPFGESDAAVPLTLAEPAAPAPVRAPLDPKIRKRVILISSLVGGVVLLVIIAAVAVSVLSSTVFSPRAEAAKYLDALVAHDASTAVAVGHISTQGAGAALLNDKTFAKTTGGVTKYTITNTTVSGDDAIVTATVSQGAASVGSPMTLTLHRTGKSFLVFDTWAIRPVALPSLYVATTSTAISVNGQEVDVPKAAASAGQLQLRVFPGEYRVTLAGDTKYVSAAPASATVSARPGAAAQVQLTAEPTAAFQDALTTQIGDFLTSCAAQKKIQPSGCPFSYYGFGTVKNVKWKIDSVPKLTLRPNEDGTWDVSTEEAGAASISFDESYFGYSSHENGTSSIYLHGTADLSSGTPVFTYDGQF